MTDKNPITNGKTPDGKFAPGNEFGKAHKVNNQKTMKEFKAALLAAVNNQDIFNIGKELIKQALSGDKKAIDLLFKYVLPQESTIDINTSDIKQQLDELDVALGIGDIIEQKLKEAEFAKGNALADGEND